jgi:hypothetical protein
MDSNRKTDRILKEWDAVTASARRPASAPHRRRAGGAWSGLGLAASGLLAAAIVVAVVWLGGHTTGVGDSTPIPSLGASPVASAPLVAASDSPAPTTVPTTAPTPTPPTIAPCDPEALAARVTSWEGAAGSRIGNVTVTSTGSDACTLTEMARPMLIDGRGAVLAQGRLDTDPGRTIDVRPGTSLTTEVLVSNVCGAAPVPPVTVAFDLGGDRRLVAEPVSPTDATVPPCNGPGMPAEIQMHAWSR